MHPRQSSRCWPKSDVVTDLATKSTASLTAVEPHQGRRRQRAAADSRGPRRSLTHLLSGPGLLAVPACVFLLLFAIYPIVTTIVNSFRNVTVTGLITGNLPFVGLDNFVMVLKDPKFAQSALLAVIFTVVCVAAQFTLGLALALLLNRRFAGRGLLRGILMIPWVLPIVVIASTFKWMFQSGNGLVNTVLRSIDPNLAVGWLESATPAFIAIVIANIWLGFPFAMSNLSAALQTLPTAVLEAAVIDGASNRQRFWHVVLPMLRGPILILLTLQVIYTFNVFELILVMTGGGPAGSTEVITYYVYQMGFAYFELGPASAATVLMLVFLGAFSALYLRLAARSEARG